MMVDDGYSPSLKRTWRFLFGLHFLGGSSGAVWTHIRRFMSTNHDAPKPIDFLTEDDDFRLKIGNADGQWAVYH